MESVLKFPDLLRVEGVMAKGYGIICKYPMQDIDLDISAKAIYALLCALAGNDHSVFPSRDKILGWLGMGRDRYNSGMKQLKEQGYILVEQVKSSGSRFAHNSYTIISNPKKFVDQKLDSDGGELTFGYTGLKSAGYGMLPRMVMFDQRLSCTAKVIYAYLASFSGAGQVAFPKTEMIRRHLGLSKDTFFKHMKQLVETNYISRVQRHINGRLASNSYHLNDCPDTESADQKHTVAIQTQCPKKPATVQYPKNQATDIQAPKKQTPTEQPPIEQIPAIQTPIEQTPENLPITNNSSFINSSFINIPSINTIRHWTDGLSREEIVEIVREHLELELYTTDTREILGITMPDSAIHQFMDIVSEFISSQKQTITVRGKTYSREEAIDNLLDLSLAEYQAVYDQITKVKTPIKAIRKYILASLVTITEDIELKIDLEVKRDFGHSS